MADQTTTAAPNSTSLQSEVSSAVPDATVDNSAAPRETHNTTTNEPAIPPTATEKDAGPSLTDVQKLWALARSHGHPEIWGVTLSDPDSHIPTQIILQKYLNANDGDLLKAKDQLIKTLDWRAKTKPLDLIGKKYTKAKFNGLGYVTTYTTGSAADHAADPESKEVFTWNIYGNVTSIEETFGNQAEFMEWRTALMEMSLQSLNISAATKPITIEYDPYKIYQVHDYKSTSFFRSPPQVRAAAQETVKVFAQVYPELLKEKFFVNVPAIMGFFYGFMKLFVAAKTIKKFHPMSNGGAMAQEFGGSKVTGLGAMLPKEYGGKGEDLKSSGTEPALV